MTKMLLLRWWKNFYKFAFSSILRLCGEAADLSLGFCHITNLVKTHCVPKFALIVNCKDKYIFQSLSPCLLRNDESLGAMCRSNVCDRIQQMTACHWIFGSR